jgi:hypothetical protein
MIHEPQASKEQRCVCDPESWGHDPDEICAGFVAGSMKAAWCETCGHDEECHLPRPPAASEPMVSQAFDPMRYLLTKYGDSNSAPLLIALYCNGPGEAFVYAVYGRAIDDGLDVIVSEWPGEEPEERGMFWMEARWDRGQFGEYGRCEIAPHYELETIHHEPIATEAASTHSQSEEG